MDLYHVVCQGLQNSLVMTIDSLDVYYRVREKQEDKQNQES